MGQYKKFVSLSWIVSQDSHIMSPYSQSVLLLVIALDLGAPISARAILSPCAPYREVILSRYACSYIESDVLPWDVRMVWRNFTSTYNCDKFENMDEVHYLWNNFTSTLRWTYPCPMTLEDDLAILIAGLLLAILFAVLHYLRLYCCPYTLESESSSSQIGYTPSFPPSLSEENDPDNLSDRRRTI